jgi:hypothetical protein
MPLSSAVPIYQPLLPLPLQVSLFEYGVAARGGREAEPAPEEIHIGDITDSSGSGSGSDEEEQDGTGESSAMADGSAGFSGQAPAPAGRGRGASMPAWMTRASDALASSPTSAQALGTTPAVPAPAAAGVPELAPPKRRRLALPPPKNS